MVEAKVNPVACSERRRDPRTDRGFSLLNLLRTRAEREGWHVVVVGTCDGHLLASSRGDEDRFAQRAAAHVSRAVFARPAPSPFDGGFVVATPRRPDARLVGRALTVRGQTVFVAVVTERGEPDGVAVGDVASGVERILLEPARALVGARS
jgi:hypothetical protein